MTVNEGGPPMDCRPSPPQPIVEDGYGGYNNVLNTRSLCLEWNRDNEVCVAGTFSNWQPVPMQKRCVSLHSNPTNFTTHSHSFIPRNVGSYASTLELPVESSFEYKFVVNGEWHHKEDMVWSLNSPPTSSLPPSLPPSHQPPLPPPFPTFNISLYSLSLSLSLSLSPPPANGQRSIWRPQQCTEYYLTSHLNCYHDNPLASVQ